jgi:hypothetical protein
MEQHTQCFLWIEKVAAIQKATTHCYFTNLNHP